MFTSIKVGTARTPVTLIGVVQGESKLPRGVGEIDKAAGGAIAEAIRRPGFRGEAGEITPATNDCLIIGLGKRDELNADVLRLVGGRAIKALDRMAPRSVHLVIAGAIPARQVAPEDAGCAIAEGMTLANWRVDFFDGSATQHEKPNPALTLDADEKKFKAGMKDGVLLGECTNYSRQRSATPPNICNPTWVASEARKLAKETGLKCTVIDFKRATQLGMGGIVNVGKASSSKPCLVLLEHNPRKKAAKAKNEKIALIGKTITYDTGGYSLKISGAMKGMKNDKNGGMAVLGAMRAIAMRKTPVHVIGMLPCAENMISGEAYRPDDIITMYNKATVEVTNTDAEGRLVLADALAYACDKVKPTAIFDIATLTGGVVVALGKWSCGVWANRDVMYDRLERTSCLTGERVWRMPIWKEHKDFMRAKHADLWNSGPARDGHPIQGAAFLSHFVDEDIPWAHIDIAGTSAVDNDNDLYVQGPTGFGVRLLARTVEGFTQ